MSTDQFVCFQQSCTHFTEVGDAGDMQKHEAKTNKSHTFIKAHRLNEKIKNLSEKIAESVVSLDGLRQEINSKVQQIIKAINIARDQAIANLDREVVCLWFDSNKLSKSVEKGLAYIDHLMKRKLTQFTCQQMTHILKSAQRTKDKEFIKKYKEKIDKKANQLRSEFEDKMSTQLKGFLEEVHKEDQKQETKNRSISLNEPTISSIRLQKQSFISKKSTFSFVQMLQLSQKNSMISDSSEDSSMARKKWKKVKDNKSEVGNADQVSKSVISQLNKLTPKVNKQTLQKQERSQKTQKDQSSSQLSSFLRSEYFQQQSLNIKQQEEISAGHQFRNESGSQSETSEEDENQLNQTILQFQRHILQNDQILQSSQTQATFTTIQKAQKYKKLDAMFSLKVAIVKVLYYSVLQSRIPKIKYIAGDHTGYGVFFTNYCPGLKVGTQLEMRDCKFRGYLGSDQIINNNKFRIMREQQSKIKVNLKGHKLNKIITKDLYYPLPDKRCNLIRQVADLIISRKYQNYFIKRMMVQVVTVLNNWGNYVFCIVGDSSGMMLAYLKKGRVKTIKEQVVVRLLNVRAVRGEAKNGQFSQEIMYLDTLQDKSKVLEHSFDFLQVDNKMMTLQ